MSSSFIVSQDKLILDKLMDFYNKDDNLLKMINIINGKTKISLRIVDWFVTNYAKKYYTIIDSPKGRFKVHVKYKQELKAYNKKRFDPFCRWQRITIPYKENTLIETTIGQLNFFKWALEKQIIHYIETHYEEIEKDMILRNSISKNKNTCKNEISIDTPSKSDDNKHNILSNTENAEANTTTTATAEQISNMTNYTENIVISGKVKSNAKTRKKREELSISAIKSIKKEHVEIIINFN